MPFPAVFFPRTAGKLLNPLIHPGVSVQLLSGVDPLPLMMQLHLHRYRQGTEKPAGAAAAL